MMRTGKEDEQSDFPGHTGRTADACHRLKGSVLRGGAEAGIQVVCADWITLVVRDFDNSADAIREGVTKLCAKFPLYE